MDAISYSYADKQAKRIKKFINEPDSVSGIVTVPKTIASGETVTVPTGRVAILPNVVVDGTLTIDGEVFIPSGSTFGDLDAQIALKADTSYVDTQLELKANTADLKEIGVGQTWQDVTASRVAGTTYTNTTGKPIQLYITCLSNSGTAVVVSVYVNGVYIGSNSTSAIAAQQSRQNVYNIIPDGATYSISISTSTIATWFELR